MPLSHRYARIEDLPEVYVMYLAALSDLGEEYDEGKAFNYMVDCYNRAPCILLLEDDNIIGFAGLYVYIPRYNDKKYFREYMFYIQPPFRGLSSWRYLCKSVQKVSDEFKIPFVGEHRLQGSIKHHQRLIKMAGAKPVAILSLYEASE